MRDFKHWDKQFKQGNMFKFNIDEQGLLWLKLKSIIRKNFVQLFAEFGDIALRETTLDKAFAELFSVLAGDIAKANLLLDAFIRKISAEQIASVNIDKLVSELYKLRNYEWGGDYQNSLDKYLVRHYVKTDNPSYENLISRFDAEINPAVRGYVLNSWFNYWSSILIENIFKSHHMVLPTIGKVKSVDFFIHGLPFDLKVTYFPSEYLAAERKARSFPVELTFLKKQATDAGIMFDKFSSPDSIRHEIREKMKDRNDAVCRKTLNTLKKQNRSIIRNTINNPDRLKKWLYENQGEMRFGSENRIYLLLVDADDFSRSWRLKRDVDLLRPAIIRYLDSFSIDGIRGKKIDFKFKGKAESFSAFADIIFILKSASKNSGKRSEDIR
jgi:hypothetical protein